MPSQLGTPLPRTAGVHLGGDLRVATHWSPGPQCCSLAPCLGGWVGLSLKVGGAGVGQAGRGPEHRPPPPQSCCSRLQKVLEPHKPECCRSREPWALYLFSPQNR